MGTSVSDVYDLFMTQIKDYRLVTLYEQSEADFLTYLQGWLVQAIAEFDAHTNTDLTVDFDNGEFDSTLTYAEQSILATMMTQYWLKKEIQDVMQMNLHIQDRDFKVYAEANNLKEKSVHYDKLKEEISQKLVDYGYQNNDWSSWFSGNFVTV